jgi:uncharacterized repeat protein (TIGR01451 family)
MQAVVFDDGTLVNTATVTPPGGTTDPTPGNNSATDSDTIPTADLSVTKTDGAASVVPGTSDTYTITVTNNGPDTVTSVTLTDTIPAALSNTSFAPSVGTYDVTSGVWSGLSLASGDSVSMTLSGTINPSATGTLSNTVTVAPPAGTTDTNSANDAATDTDTLTPQADLAITKTDGVTTVAAGTSDTYTIVVTNTGPSAVTGAHVVDVLPAGVTGATWTFTGSTGGGSVSGLPSGSGNLDTTVDLPVNATVTFTFTPTIDPSATGVFTNTATVTPPAGTTDPIAGNNSFTDTDTLTPAADLSITKSDGVTNFVPGGSTTYNIVVSNAGPSTAVDSTVTDLFPAAFTAVSWTAVASAGSSVAQASGTGNIITPVTLLPGGTAIFTAVAQISPSATGSLTNTATVTPPAGFTDTNPGNNTATDTDTLTVPGTTDLQVTITDGTTSVVPGTIDTYTITVSNNGPETLSSVTLIDAIPAALLNASFAPSVGAYDVASGVWSGLSLASGQSVGMTLSGTIDPHATGTITNTVTVFAPAGMTETNLVNNVATDTDTLTLFRLNPSPPPGTSANMITRRVDGLYAIYDIGNNATLAAHPLAQVGTDWQFAGFNGSDPSDMMLRNSTSGAFQVYDVSNNNITGSAALGAVGLNWQVAGFGNFSSLGETDMMLRDANTGGFQVYDIANNQITGTAFMGMVGLDWQVGGFGNFSSRGTSDMILRNTNTGGLQVYDIDSNQITGTASMGTIGLEWQFSGFGNFSSGAGATDMIMRNTNTGALLLYDIANNQITGTAVLGTVGLDWQFAGVAPIHAPGASDLVLRNVNTGAFEVYDIANNQIIGAASLGQVGLEWQLGGFAADPPSAPSSGSDRSTSQLVQAMAGFGGGSGGAENLNAVPLIPNPIDQNPWAHWRSPMDMMRQGWSTSLFHAAQQWSTRSS